jgi:lipoprotein NlpI
MKYIGLLFLSLILATSALSQDNSAKAHWNVCATAYNNGINDVAISECKKTIALDPSRADAYFVLGSVYVGEATIDAKGNFTAQPGTIDLLKKYLELAPNGAHAADTQAMIDILQNKK